MLSLLASWLRGDAPSVCFFHAPVGYRRTAPRPTFFCGFLGLTVFAPPPHNRCQSLEPECFRLSLWDASVIMTMVIPSVIASVLYGAFIYVADQDHPERIYLVIAAFALLGWYYRNDD
jgi:hypothetical protein